MADKVITVEYKMLGENSIHIIPCDNWETASSLATDLTNEETCYVALKYCIPEQDTRAADQKSI